MKQQITWVLFFLLLICLNACTSTKPVLQNTAMDSGPVYPETRFIVISDLHFYDTSLGMEGKAFQDYLDNDRKLLVLSNEIIGTAMGKIAQEQADFVLVAGDMTKDGEKICHQGVIRHLETLNKSGKQIFVIPGNHDISNPESVRFIKNRTEPEPSVSPAEFKDLYQEYGYGQAIAHDPDSLSYVAEPVKGLRILALDSNRYQENKPGNHSIVGGAFSKQTLNWIENQLIVANKEKNAVIVFQHHGIMEHYPGNEKFYGEYLVKDHEKIAALFARFNVRLVFTGHFHAQDITQKTINDSGKIIFDIETGSMVTAPCPYRIIEIEKNAEKNTTASISSRFITEIPSLGKGFADYASNYVFEGTKKLANNSLTKYRVSKQEQPLINAQVAAAYTAHLKGDEKKPATIIDTTGFGYWLKFIAWLQKDLIEGWWTDLEPGDNDIVIDLDTGISTASK